MCTKVLNILDKLINWIDEVPPIEQPQRFGNKAFKTWLDKVKEASLIEINFSFFILNILRGK